MKIRDIAWQGLSSPTPRDELHKIEEIVIDLTDRGFNKLTLEIGSYQGATAALFAQYFESVYCIDPWGEEDKAKEGNRIASYVGKPGHNKYFPIFTHNIDELALTNCVFPIVSTSICLTDLPCLNLDFVFLDGGHVYEAASLDLRMIWRHCHKDSIVIAHDYMRDGYGYPPFSVSQVDPYIGVKQAVDEEIQAGRWKEVDRYSGLIALQKVE